MKMTDRPSHNLDGLDINLARRIDEVCRRFEADWRQGRQPRVDDYMGEVLDEGQPALRAELEALERELRRSEETVTRAEPTSAADALTIAPEEPPATPTPGMAHATVREEATVAPSD